MALASITIKCDPKTGEVLNAHEIQMPKIDASQIPPLVRRLIGRTFYESMVEFYKNPENRRRFEEWQAERERAATLTPQ